MPYEEILYSAKGPVGYLTFLNKKTTVWKDR